MYANTATAIMKSVVMIKLFRSIEWFCKKGENKEVRI